MSALVSRFGEVIDAAARLLGRANEAFKLRTLFRVVVKGSPRIRGDAFLCRHIRVTADEASVHTDPSRTLYPIRHVAFTRREERAIEICAVSRTRVLRIEGFVSRHDTRVTALESRRVYGVRIEILDKGHILFRPD